MITKEKLLRAFYLLNEQLEKVDQEVQLCIYGGGAIVLAYNLRSMTKDVDGVFTEPSLVRELSRKISQEVDLPEDWLNDGVKDFLSREDSAHQTLSDMPQFSHLRVTRPTTQYLFAMKCLASRIGQESRDGEDILSLAKILKLQTAEGALQLVERLL